MSEGDKKKKDSSDRSDPSDQSDEITVKEWAKPIEPVESEEETTANYHVLKTARPTRADLPTQKKRPAPLPAAPQRSGSLKLRLFFVGFALLGLLAGMGALWWQKSAKTAETTARSGHTQASNKRAPSVPLRLSPLLFYAGDQLTNPRMLKPGSVVTVRFFVESWDDTQPLNLSADVKIYSGRGALLAYQPKYVEFSKKVDKTAKKIQVDTQIKLSKDIPPDRYRMMIELTDLATLRRSTLQSKLVIIK